MNAIYLILLLISAAALAFQVALTRFFALMQGSHLAFMAVSLALLGIGASGTYLSLRPSSALGVQRILSLGAILFALSIPAAYLAINYLPFDAYRIAWEHSQLIWLALYYLALTVPFFFSGLIIGAALAAQPERAGPIYAANLFGSGLGPPLALFALATLGGVGTIFLCALLGWLAAGVAQWSRVKGQGSGVMPHTSEPKAPYGRTTYHVPRITHHVSRFIFLAVVLILLYLMFRPPALFDIRLTPYKSLSQAMLYPDSKIVFSEWNAFSRVDVIRSEVIRSAPGLSFTYPGQIPPQLGLTVDGDNLGPITQPNQPAFTGYLPLALGFELRPNAEILILEPGGGLAVLAALQNGARTVTVVQSNHTVAAAVGHYFADFNHQLYADPRVTMVIDEPRSFLRRTNRQFDLIILPLTDSFRPVTAGAYTLNEDYRYTVEAFSDALAHLSPAGLLLVERWLQLPPSESLRLWGTAVATLRLANGGQDQGAAAVSDPGAHLLALRSLQTSLIGLARSPLLAQDIATTRRFAMERQFDPIWLPGIQPAETNRYSVLPESVYYQTFTDLLTASDPATFFATYPYAVAPPTDDHPFFFHFFKWGQTPQILETLGKTWQPFGGSGYLVLVALLILVLVLSAVLILLPLLWLKNKAQNLKTEAQELPTSPLPFSHLPPSLHYPLYFALLGLGFLFVEIPLLQRFILYLGQPAYAFAIVVSALLVASGLGSNYLSARWPLRLVLPGVAILTLIYPLLLSPLFDATLRLPFAGRVAVTIITLFPLGLLLGIPFPGGLILVGQTSPQLTPWVWAVNGCASVISAVLAAMIALTWSFSAVLWSAAAAYALAWLVIVPYPSLTGRGKEVPSSWQKEGQAGG